MLRPIAPLLALVLVAGPAAATDAIPPAAMEAAQAIFKARCALCHGPAGGGDGPASAALSPRARDMRDPAWQASVTDAHIEAIIRGGGPAVGKSPIMPGNPDLKDRPDVLRALRVLVRGFAAAATPAAP